MAGAVHDSNHPLDQIAQLFDQFEQSHESHADNPADTNNAEARRPLRSSSEHEPPALTPKEDLHPSFVIDAGLRMVWQNPSAAAQLWHYSQGTENPSTPAHIFDLLLNPEFRQHVDNWRQWLSFFMVQALQMLSKDELSHHIKQQDKSKQELLSEMMESAELQEKQRSHLNCLSKKNGAIVYHIDRVDFREGRFFRFRPETADATIRRHAARPIELNQHFEHLNLQHDPVRTVFFILAACLNHAEILQTELLPEEFSRLHNKLMHRFIAIIESYGGIFELQPGIGLVAYFLPKNQNDSPMAVIDCALQIRSQVIEISREWKIRKGWLHDIELNMAMHRADEFIGLLPTQLGNTLLTHGSALSICSQLCRLASNGQIWSTKDLVNQLDNEEINKLSFGIYRRNNHRPLLVGKSFSRLSDLSDLDLNMTRGHVCNDELAVTQIFDR